MSALGGWLLDLLCRSLTRDEREAVLGDLYEQQATFRQAVYELLTLLLHRQRSHWLEWRPWFVLLCVIAPIGIVLSQITRSISGFLVMQLWTRWQSGAWFRSALSGRMSLIAVVCICCAICFSAWCSGVVISAFSRATLAVNASALYALWLAYSVNSQSGTATGLYTVATSLALFVIPSYSGMQFALPSQSSWPRFLILLLSAALTVFAIWSDGLFLTALARWSSGALPGETMAMRSWPFAVSVLPSLYLFFSATRTTTAKA